MSWTKNNPYFLAALSGVMLTLAFPPLPLWILSFIAFIPLFYAIEYRLDKGKFLMLYLAFFIYHAGSNWWISSWREQTDPYLMASGIAVALVHPLLLMLPFFIYSRFRKKFGLTNSIILFPFIWSGFEWAHGLGELSYPWLSIGYTQIYNSYWVQIADIFGVYGIGFILALFNSIAFLIINDSSKFRFGDLLAKRYRYKIIVLAMIAVIPNIYGVIQKNYFDHTRLLNSNPRLKVGVVQPSINPWLKWQGDVFGQVQFHKNIQDSLCKAYGNIDLAIWSETAVPFLNLTFNSNLNFPFIENWLSQSNTALLTGFTHIYFYKKGQTAPPTAKKLKTSDFDLYDSFNSAILFNPDSSRHDYYHKMRLTPFAERLPYADYIAFAKSWFEWGVGISSWQLGRDQHNLVLNKNSKKVSIAPIICIESIYPDFVANFIDQGANLLVVITNDAWYDYTVGPEQHYIISQMRAIENRRYLVRCANTGVSGFIAPTGESISRLPQYRSMGLAQEVALLDVRSFYSIFKDLLSMISAAITLIILIYTWIKRK